MNEAITQAIATFGNNLKSKHLVGFSGIIFFSLFWFCAIYLIAPNFYKNNPIFISVILSLLFGIIYFFWNVMISILTSSHTTFDLTNDSNQSIALIDAFVYSVAYFCPLLWFCYYYANEFIPCTQIRPNFFLFTNTTFIWATIRIFFAYRKFKTTINNIAENTNSN
jgi:hypothetical protein